MHRLLIHYMILLVLLHHLPYLRCSNQPQLPCPTYHYHHLLLFFCGPSKELHYSFHHFLRHHPLHHAALFIIRRDESPLPHQLSIGSYEHEQIFGQGHFACCHSWSTVCRIQSALTSCASSLIPQSRKICCSLAQDKRSDARSQSQFSYGAFSCYHRQSLNCLDLHIEAHLVVHALSLFLCFHGLRSKPSSLVLHFEWYAV